jgi:hypothetical protein
LILTHLQNPVILFCYINIDNLRKREDKIKSIPRMRFTEQEGSDNPDGLDINIKFNDENKNFLFVRLNFYYFYRMEEVKIKNCKEEKDYQME